MSPYRRVIDAHVHWYPREFVDLMIRKGPANGAVMSEDAKGNPVVASVPGCTQKSTMRKSMTNLEDIIAAMEDRNVDTNALSMTNPLVYWAPPGFGLELSAAHNDACVDAHHKYPDRFYGTIVLPMQDVKLAAEELEGAEEKAVRLADPDHGLQHHGGDVRHDQQRDEEVDGVVEPARAELALEQLPRPAPGPLVSHSAPHS